MSYDLLDTHRLVDLQNPINWSNRYAQSLLCWYKGLAGRDGGQTWYDLCNRHHGTFVPTSAKPSWTGSRMPGSASSVDFDGGGGYVDCSEGAGDFDLNLTELTIVADVFPRAATPFPGIVGKGNSDSLTAGSYLMYMSSGPKYNWIVYTGSTRQVALATGNIVAVNTWQQVAVTWKASDFAEIYVDGVLRVTPAATGVSIDNTAFKLILGSNEGSGNLAKYPLNGMLDNVRIYTRKWNGNNIAGIYQQSRDGFPGILNRPTLATREPVASTTVAGTRYFFFFT